MVRTRQEKEKAKREKKRENRNRALTAKASAVIITGFCMQDGLESRVLILNRAWQAIATTSLKKALVLLYRGAARAVEGHNFETLSFAEWLEYSRINPGEEKDRIHTPSFFLRKPEVIILVKYTGHRANTRISLNLRNLAKRDGNRCGYCGKGLKHNEMSLDHIIPKSRKGITSWENCVLSCLPCNNFKDDRTPIQAGLTLRIIPHFPNWSILPSGADVLASWEPFLKK